MTYKHSILPTWAIVAILVGLPIVGGLTTWVLLEIVDTTAETGKIDVIRTGITFTVALGGLIALFLAARRQRSTEIDLQQKNNAHELHERIAEDNATHQIRVAASTEHDATERRAAETFARAMEQIASEAMHVRIGGLYALERLAESNKSYRQLVTNVLCAYLRTRLRPIEVDPYSDDPSDSDEITPEEWHVRFAAQEILGMHADPQMEATYWPTRINLSGAHLMDAFFYDCRFSGASFADATFHGRTNFLRCDFRGTASFARAKFIGSVNFNESVAATQSIVLFGRSRFFDDAAFTGVSFGHADFRGAAFSKAANFVDASAQRFMMANVVFGGSVEFPGDAEVSLVAASARKGGFTRKWPSGWRTEDVNDSDHYVRLVHDASG